MIRIIIAFLLALTISASAQSIGTQPNFSQLLPAPVGGCSNSLNFSQTCNSMYVGLTFQ